MLSVRATIADGLHNSIVVEMQITQDGNITLKLTIPSNLKILIKQNVP